MNTWFLVFFKIIIVFLISSSCSTTVELGRTVKYSRRYMNENKIIKGKIGISISLYDNTDKKELAINDVRNLPGEVIDSTYNSKLLIFHKDSIPKFIRIDKPGKSPLVLFPEASRKNLIIYKIFLVRDIKGVL